MINRLKWIILLFLGITSMITDSHNGKLYNRITIPAALFGLWIRLAFREGNALQCLVIMAAVYIILFPAWKSHGLGAGDIKLLMSGAAFLSGEEYVFFFVISFLISGCAALYELLKKKGQKRQIKMGIYIGTVMVITACLKLIRMEPFITVLHD